MIGRVSQKHYYAFILLFTLNSGFSVYSQTDSISDLLNLSIEKLMQIDIVTATGNNESKFVAPATILVITADDIQKRGYTDLAEIIKDLPGFDVIDPGGRGGVVAYQRGYRTPITQRTLLMIDGIVDNDLWSNEALLGRQYPIYNIERIEVLYGPTSALYGANAFLGIINIITKNGALLKSEEQKIIVSSQFGSYSTRSVEIAANSRKNDLSYSLSSKFYKSNGADLSKKWGFSSNDLYSDTSIWGPVLQHQNYNVRYGKYYSPEDNYGIIGNVAYKGTKLGLINWVDKEGYGEWYTADRAQNNAFWKKSSLQLFLENKTEFNKFKLNSLFLHRRNRVWGNWAEAEPDWNPGMEQYSYISITEWNSVSNSWLLKEDAGYQVNEKILIQAGIKYERKELTKAYDIPGYWGAFSSSVPSSAPGPHGYGAGVGHSTDSSYVIVAPPNADMPEENLLLTDDMGAYLQLIADVKKIRFNVGFRYDNNSFYGGNTNIRASTIYQLNKKSALKLIYGEAYQEPSPKQLFGGWNGRKANIDLLPEKARNYELVGMYGLGPVALETSLFYAMYENVIKEEAENAGERRIYGAEFRSYFNFKNMIPGSSVITGYLFYTYTEAISSIHYDHSTAMWQKGETELGDIAPHKINAGLNIPVLKMFNVNLRGNYVSERLVYTRNALRARDYRVAPYFTLDGTISFKYKLTTLSFKVKNIADTNYFEPGVEQADSGDDFTKRSLGYRNSLLPQEGRTFIISLNIDL